MFFIQPIRRGTVGRSMNDAQIVTPNPATEAWGKNRSLAPPPPLQPVRDMNGPLPVCVNSGACSLESSGIIRKWRKVMSLATFYYRHKTYMVCEQHLIFNK